MSETTLKELNVPVELLPVVARDLKDGCRILHLGREAYKVCEYKDTEIIYLAVEKYFEDVNAVSNCRLLRAVFNLVIVEELPRIISLYDLKISLPTKLTAMALYLSDADGFVTGTGTSYTFVQPVDDCRIELKEVVMRLLRDTQDYVLGGKEFTENFTTVCKDVYVYAKLEED